MVKQTAERLLLYQVLRCFRVVWSQFWAFSKCLSALETTTNNQEVKRSLHRLQNVNNLPKDLYIRVCLTCRSLAELFNFIGLVELQEYRIHLIDFININKHSRLINSNLFTKIEDQCSEGQWSSKSGRQASSRSVIIAQMVNKQPSDFWVIKFHAVLQLLEANSGVFQNVYRL